MRLGSKYRKYRITKLLTFICDLLVGRWYALYCSGHGSAFKRDPKLMTRTRALYEACRWEGVACTIGGRSEVVNIFTSKLVFPERLRGCSFNATKGQ